MKETLNEFFVEVFGSILSIEEKSLEKSGFKNLSISEMHLIHGIHNAVESGKNQMTALALRQGITKGSISVAVKTLEKKKFVKRKPSPNDKRITLVELTPQGIKAYESHYRFHQMMIDSIVSTLSPQQSEVLKEALQNLTAYFKNALAEN